MPELVLSLSNGSVRERLGDWAFYHDGKTGKPQAGLQVNGIIPQQSVSVVDVKWHGSTAIELFYKCADGQPGTQLLYRTQHRDALNYLWKRIFTLFGRIHYSDRPKARTRARHDVLFAQPV
jgi:hypothetical protein